MKDWITIQKRYLQDSVPIQLGGLASNLRRITSFSMYEGNREQVESLIQECKFFIEWTAKDTHIDAMADLADLQREITSWQRNWIKIWSGPILRKETADISRRWSDRVLEMTVFLD